MREGVYGAQAVLNPSMDFKMFENAGIYDGQTYAGTNGKNLSKFYEPSELVSKSYLKTLVRKDARTSTSDEFAAGTKYSTTSGSLPIFPVWVMPEIKDIPKKDHPLFNLFRRKAVMGKTIDFNQRTARGAASGKFELASMAATVDTLSRVSIPIKAQYSVRIISNFDVAVNKGYVDMYNEEIMSATEALMDYWEEKLISGDASTYAYEFSGLDNLITTNTENQSGVALTLGKIDELTRWAKQGAKTSIVGSGKPNIHVTNYATYEDIKNLLRAWQRNNDSTVLNWGITSYSIDGIPVIVSPFASITASSRRWYTLSLDTWFIGMLQDMTFSELPFDGDGKKIMIKSYGALSCEAEMFNAMAYGIL